MTDWADGIESRNYGIRNEIDVHMLSELVGIIVALAMVAGSLLFYSWTRHQIVNTGYESQNLFAVEESLLRTQGRLILEEAVLSDPGRIDLIARTELGMAPLHPRQLIFSQIPDAEHRRSDAMAMADSKAGNSRRAGAVKHLGDYAN